MTDAEIQTISKLCDALRARGVRRCEIPGSICVEFMPSADEMQPPKPEIAKPWCKCGHEEYQHMNGMCVTGCAPERCLDVTP